jgi:hypothetical protein
MCSLVVEVVREETRLDPAAELAVFLRREERDPDVVALVAGAKPWTTALAAHIRASASDVGSRGIIFRKEL